MLYDFSKKEEVMPHIKRAIGGLVGPQIDGVYDAAYKAVRNIIQSESWREVEAVESQDLASALCFRIHARDEDFGEVDPRLIAPIADVLDWDWEIQKLCIQPMSFLESVKFHHKKER